MRWFIVLIFLMGFGFSGWGVWGLYSFAKLGDEPIDVKLADIEAGRHPKSLNWRITDYYARTDQSVLELFSDAEAEDPLFATKDEIRYYYYPILPGERPEDGGTGPVGEFSVLVRSSTKKRITGPDRPIEGSMAVGILSLSSELRDDLQEVFPRIDARKVILFVEGGRAKGTMRYWVVAVFGGLIVLVGIWLVVEKRE